MAEQLSPHDVAHATEGSDILTMPPAHVAATGYRKSTSLLNFIAGALFMKTRNIVFQFTATMC
jgi:hypothetical protein